MDEYVGLLILPDEILLHIFKETTISIEDIFSLSKVCHRIENICKSEDLWKLKFIHRWPWIWKKIRNKLTVVGCWKEEVSAALEFTDKFNSRLQSLSHELYKYKNITAPVLSSITSLLSSRKLGSLYCLNELRNICRPINSSNKNLTKKFYALLVFQDVHQLVCREEWKEFFLLPPAKQTLERGAFLFAKWFQPIDFLDLDLADMTSSLDNLAVQVLSHLGKNFPQNGAVSHRLLDPDEPLSGSLWPRRECEELFTSINHVLFTVNGFQGNHDYYEMDNSFINRVMSTKKGIPVTLSIIYSAVCHRLGILLYPVNCPSHFMMKWRVPGSDSTEYIDAFNGGLRESAGKFSLHNHPSTAERENTSTSTFRVLERMANNTVYVGQRNLQNYDRFTEMCSAAEISAIFKPNNEDTLEFIYSLSLSFELHVDRIVTGCSELLEEKPHLSDRFGRLETEAHKLLAEQMRGPRPIIKKDRPSSSMDKVQFAVGMIMVHKLYGYTCVIYGWDTTCKMPMEWIKQMNVLDLKYKQHQPFYTVLGHDGSQRYAAQENLLATKPIAVTHKEIGKYFDEFNGLYYVPNAELEIEYPDDDVVRRKRMNRYHTGVAV